MMHRFVRRIVADIHRGLDPLRKMPGWETAMRDRRTLASTSWLHTRQHEANHLIIDQVLYQPVGIELRGTVDVMKCPDPSYKRLVQVPVTFHYAHRILDQEAVEDPVWTPPLLLDDVALLSQKLGENDAWINVYLFSHH